MATLDEQIELEHRMVQSGIDRYMKQKNTLQEKNLESKTKHGRSIIAGVCEPLTNALVIALKKPRGNNDRVHKLIKDINPSSASFLALLSVIDNVASHSRLVSVAHYVGKQLETQDRLDKWIKIDPEVARNLIKLANKKSDKGFDHKRHGLNHKMHSDGVDITDWSKTDRMKVGLFMINLIIEHTGIVKLRKKYGRNKTITYLDPTPDTLEWIKAFNNTHMNNLPRYSPCIIQPKEWKSFYGGGYYSKHINSKPFMRIHGL
ncbi:MAG: putative RNA polymerase [Prokaryotic dsDNA virus sp.]|jgi:DNA-directed RNA polymerase|nr:MAG: putative RNA polymerase [Prokaryotic dsDNA virus sp.]|tara:strand:- start:370 stop:1152 length:783 start_codon:yes stop_codon:yes gene_type:complete